MGISKKALFISLGVIGGASAIAGGGLLIVKLQDHGNTYEFPPAKPKEKVYKFNNKVYRASELAEFLISNNYKVDARSKNDFMDNVLGGSYWFFKDDSTYTSQAGGSPTRIADHSKIFTDSKGKVLINPIDTVTLSQYYNRDIRLFVNGEEYSYREFQGTPALPIADMFGPKLHLFKDEDVTNKETAPVELKETNDMVYSVADDQWYSSEELFVAHYPGFGLQTATLTDLNGFKDGDQIVIDGITYIVTDNGGALKAHNVANPSLELDLSTKHIRWNVPGTENYYSSVTTLLPETVVRKTTPSEVYDEFIEWSDAPSKVVQDIDVSDIIIDGIKYQGFEYIPQFDKPLNNWYKVGLVPDSSTLLDPAAKYYIGRFEGSDAVIKVGQTNLHTSQDEVAKANNLTPIDTKYIYMQGNGANIELIEALKPVSKTISFSSDEFSKEPVIYIDNQRVFVSLAETN